MEKSYGIEAARAQLGEIADHAQRTGQTVNLTRHGRTIAVIGPAEPEAPHRKAKIRTYRVEAAFEAPPATTKEEMSGALESTFFQNERFSMRGIEVDEERQDPDLMQTWARIDAPADMPWEELNRSLRELYRDAHYPHIDRAVHYRLVEPAIRIYERPDDIDDIIEAYHHQGGGETNAPSGADQPTPHRLAFWWCPALLDGQTRTAAPTAGTFLAEFTSLGAHQVPAVGDTVTLFARHVNVIARTYRYGFSGPDERGDAHPETCVDIYVEQPLTQPF